MSAEIVGWIASILLVLLGATRQSTRNRIFLAAEGTRAAEFLRRHRAEGACWGTTILLSAFASDRVLRHELAHVKQWRRYGWRMFFIPKSLLELEVRYDMSSESLSDFDSSML